MEEVNALRGIDVYLIDQLMKGTVDRESKILDAGCGSGRNIHYLIQQGFDVTAFDGNQELITSLKTLHAETNAHFLHSTVEDFASESKFDFIICNAVLHFARNHAHFDAMFRSLVALLSNNGVLFIRMTSDIGLPMDHSEENGVYLLLDGSTRYLLTREKVDELLRAHSLSLLEPVKTVKVEELRCMTTLVLRKN
ncbi:MAG: class I SAM-dependent methyltransferase [Flavobacteriales bacterium]|nr:class I SAM-dependent methyltransferase [Flavobacteriales bacterium]